MTESVKCPICTSDAVELYAPTGALFCKTCNNWTQLRPADIDAYQFPTPDLSAIRTAREVDAALDMVNNPPHYTKGGIELCDIIQAYGLDFYQGSALKYILRHGSKGDELEDMRKAVWYLNRKVRALE